MSDELITIEREVFDNCVLQAVQRGLAQHEGKGIDPQGEELSALSREVSKAILNLLRTIPAHGTALGYANNAGNANKINNFGDSVLLLTRGTEFDVFGRHVCISNVFLSFILTTIFTAVASSNVLNDPVITFDKVSVPLIASIVSAVGEVIVDYLSLPKVDGHERCVYDVAYALVDDGHCNLDGSFDADDVYSKYGGGKCNGRLVARSTCGFVDNGTCFLPVLIDVADMKTILQSLCVAGLLVHTGDGLGTYQISQIVQEESNDLLR